jgi:hypothetical protein
MVAITSEMVPGHLKYAHKEAKFKLDQGRFDDAIAVMDVYEDLPDIAIDETVGMTAFAGLRLHQGLSCGHCPKVVKNDAGASSHYSICHKGVKKPEKLSIAHYQQFNKTASTQRSLFRVEAPQQNPSCPNTALVATLRAETDKGFKGDVHPKDLNARAISPWLLTTKWHLHVAGHNPHKLQALVEPLKHRDMPRLVASVKLYYANAIDLIARTDELTLQHLNTADPAKTYVKLNGLRLTCYD